MTTLNKNLLKIQQDQFEQLFKATDISQSLKTIGAGDRSKIEAFILFSAKDFTPTQIDTIADLFDFNDDQRARAIAQFEKTL